MSSSPLATGRGVLAMEAEVPAVHEEQRVEVLTTRSGEVGVHIWPAASAATANSAVVAFHGITDDGGVYGTVWAALAGRLPVVAIDAPGHGFTPWEPTNRYHMSLAGRQGEEVIERIGEVVTGCSGPVVLLAHSLGALPALDIAVRRPDLVAQVIIEEPPWRPLLPARERRWQREWVRKMVSSNDESRLEVFSAQWSRQDCVAWAESKARLDSRAFDVPLSWDGHLVSLFRRVRRPTTLVLGSRDLGSQNPAWLTWAYRRALGRQGHIVRIARAGHNPRRDDPEGFSALLADLIKPAHERHHVAEGN